MTTKGAGYGLVPPHLQEVDDMSKEAELMATYKIEITKLVHVAGEVKKPGDMVEVNRADRDTLVSSGKGVEVKPEIAKGNDKSKAK